MNALILRSKTAGIQYLDFESWEELLPHGNYKKKGRTNTYYKQVLMHDYDN